MVGDFKNPFTSMGRLRQKMNSATEILNGNNRTVRLH